MRQLSEKHQANELAHLPSLPAKVTTANGQVIDLASTVWEAWAYPDGGKYYKINWDLIFLGRDGQNPILTRRAWYLVKLYLADRLSRRNIASVSADYDTFLFFDRWLAKQDNSTWLADPERGFDWSDYGEAIARAFLNYLRTSTSMKGHHFSQIRAFYRWGVAHQLLDFSLAFLYVLRSIKAGGNLKGQHVRFRDVNNGPLSPDEKRVIKQALDGEQGSPQDRVIVRLHYELGFNPIAAVLLKNRYLRCYEANGSRYFQLDVPRIKKRLVVQGTKRRPISLVLGSLLLELQEGGPDDPLLSWLSQQNQVMAISYAMNRFAKANNLVSSRTNGPLKLHPRRFRYTLATHLAEEGASDISIAEALDHGSLAYVAVYRETTSTIAGPAARATDPGLVPLVHLFLGIIVESATTPVFDGLPNQVIPGTPLHMQEVPLDIGGVGLCGRNTLKDGLCKLFPPLSCYTCPFFAALRTGPHQQLLKGLEAYLYAHRDRLDRRILLQLEDVLGAIREVLAHINEPVCNQEENSHAH